ncbi:uncharacterized protein LOC116291022 [Actinia tenebrosa]|uniref:Uncharacterized protein LOC116291022 n=1 Tax=Actinia tenebrosa TaxID=6105 RepID=A0A6P8HMX1_ACTTE|nr:uncharacterized protein LOC116291022 [Actinia tenebrosa]
MIFVLLALFVASAVSLDLNREGCGSLLKGATFSATSGNAGFPSLCNKPWIPKSLDNDQKLTVDLGEAASISRVLFAGDPTKPDTTNQIKLFYSNDGNTWDCISNGSPSPCRPFYSNRPPPVKGSDVNEVDLPTVIKARYFRFQPLEPSPKYRDGSSSLRVDLIGCRE